MKTDTESSISLSVIVPIHNVGDFLEECLDCLLKQQTQSTYEVILIDDFSTDSCPEICRRYQQSHSDIFVYIRLPENKGVSSARNCGMNRVKGRYFTFVDPDDRIPSNAFESLISAIERSGADVVKGNNNLFNDTSYDRSMVNKTTESPASYNTRQERVLTGERILSEYFKHERLRGHVWGKIYRTSKFGTYRFAPEISMSEDFMFNAEVLAHASKVLLITDHVYSYRRRRSGASASKIQNNTYREWLKNLDQAKQFAVTKTQKKALHQLQVQSLLDYVRECRSADGQSLNQLIDVALSFQRKWQLNWLSLLKTSIQNPKTAFRYHRYRKTLRRLKGAANN